MQANTYYAVEQKSENFVVADSEPCKIAPVVADSNQSCLNVCNFWGQTGGGDQQQLYGVNWITMRKIVKANNQVLAAISMSVKGAMNAEFSLARVY